MKKFLFVGLLIIAVGFSFAPVNAYLFRGSNGEMDMTVGSQKSLTFYSNYSRRFYMIYEVLDPNIPPLDYYLVYTSSPWGYSWENPKDLWNATHYNPFIGTSQHGDYLTGARFTYYLEPNGRFIHFAYVNVTDHTGYYWKMEINQTNGGLYPITGNAQQFIDGAGWNGLWEARGQISIVADNESYPWIGAECTDNLNHFKYYVFECLSNNGTWNLEVFNFWDLDAEYFNNGHPLPPTNSHGGNLQPMQGKDILVVWWYLNNPAAQMVHRTLIYDEQTNDWIDPIGGGPFVDDEGDWKRQVFDIAHNLEANLTVLFKQDERDPDGIIRLNAQVFNHSDITWDTKFRVSFPETGDAGVPSFEPFVSINDNGSINFVWFIPGNASLWYRQTFPNGTLAGTDSQVLEILPFNLEENQFTSPRTNHENVPMGLQFMDEIVGDDLVYFTYLRFLQAPWTTPAVHLNTTLTTSSGGLMGDSIGSNVSDNWIFEGEVYDLVSYVENATNYFVNTSDSRHIIEFFWNNATEEMGITVDPNDQFTIGLVHTEFERTGNVTRLLWRFVPDRNIIDSMNNSWNYIIQNTDMALEINADLGIYTNIYNLGGFTYYTFTGDGGRTTGGQPFEIYATNGTDGSSARAEQIYRKLQSLHFLVEIDMDNEWEAGNGAFDIDPGVGWVDIGIDYRLNGTWIEGFYVRLYVQDANVGHHNLGNDHDWIEWQVDWYNYDPGSGTMANLRSGLVYSNHWGYDNENLSPDYHNRTSSQLWVDLWFDRTNASTTVAGQINAMYHGMREHGASWWFGYGAFQPMISDYGNSLFLDDLYDETGNVSDSMKMELMRMFIEVGKTADADGDDETWTIRAVENMNRKQADDRMRGVEQPSFEQTLVLDMPMFQSMNPLIRAIDGISAAIWLGALGFQKILWGAMDSFFAWAGFGEGFFSQITAFIMMIPNVFSSLMENMGVAMVYLATMIDSTFTAFVTMLPEFVLGLGWLTDSILSYWRTFNRLLNGELMPFNIIREIQAGTWIRFGFAILPTYEIMGILFSNNPGARLKERASFYSGIFTGAINFIKGFVSFIQQAISAIFDILPG